MLRRTIRGSMGDMSHLAPSYPHDRDRGGIGVFVEEPRAQDDQDQGADEAEPGHGSSPRRGGGLGGGAFGRRQMRAQSLQRGVPRVRDLVAHKL